MPDSLHMAFCLLLWKGEQLVDIMDLDASSVNPKLHEEKQNQFLKLIKFKPNL